MLTLTQGESSYGVFYLVLFLKNKINVLMLFSFLVGLFKNKKNRYKIRKVREEREEGENRSQCWVRRTAGA